ncbi:MAG TPA: hypothetical protein VN709_10280 [Terriglobales bacterium]|nr:hypothetical protein [Terriglobales bacterium]
MSTISKAIEDLEEQRTRIEAALRVLRSLSGGGAPRGRKPKYMTEFADAAASMPKKKRKISAAGRRRIAEAQKRRWAKVRAAKQ